MLAGGRKFLSVILMCAAAMLLASCVEEQPENGEEPPSGEATMAPMEEATEEATEDTAMEDTGMEGAMAPDAEGMVAIESEFDVDETITRLEENATEGGNMVVAEVPHSQAAEDAGLDLDPTTLLVLGNPEAGTGFIQASRPMGIDLPQKFLAWEDESGQAWLAYNDIEYLAERHGVVGMEVQTQMISANLQSLAEESATEEAMDETTMMEDTAMEDTMAMEDTAMEDTDMEGTDMEGAMMDSMEPPVGVVTQASSASFEETLANAEGAVEDEGLNLVATVDHSEGAASVGEGLPPTTLLVFGNPEAGTPLMQESQTVGIDLPQKMLVWVDGDGIVNVSYNDPEYLADRHGLEGVDENIEMISAALETLAANATGSEATTEETTMEETGMTMEETTAP